MTHNRTIPLDLLEASLRQNRKASMALPFAFSLTLLLIPVLPIPLRAQDTVPAVTGVPRVDKLLSQMTFDEKMALIRGASEDPSTNQGQAGYLAGVPRLGIPPLRMSDGPPGVLTRLPSQAETATMGLAATFSTEDARANGEVVAREAKSLAIDIVLEPFINIDRDITFMRGYNTYGEDPVLTGLIGAGFIHGVQSQGVMSQAKHYVAYDTDGSNVYVDQQTLHEIYVAPFIDAVQADVSSIMCSYNKINGAQACGNPDTLDTILRKEIGFKGFVTSDWGAVHAANFINKGLDMEMPGPGPKDSPLGSMIFSFFTTEKPDNTPPPKPNLAMMAGFFGGPLPEEPAPKPIDMGAFGTAHDERTNLWNLKQAGQLDDATVTRAAGRVLYEIEKFGYLDHPPTHQIMPHATEANAAAIQKTAEDAAVLLKNEDHILPLKPADLNALALIGPGAGQTVAIGTAGERSVGWPWRQIGTVEALKKIAPGSQVTYAVEDDMSGQPIPAALWTSNGKPGIERVIKDGAKSTDPTIDFTAKYGNPLPAKSEITWHGTLNVPTAGSYWIYLQLLGAAGELNIDGKRIEGANGLKGAVHGDTVLGGKDGLMPSTEGLDNLRSAVQLTAGAHDVTVNISDDTSGNPAQVRLAWVTPEERKINHDKAIAAAKAAKTAVVFAWSRGKQDFVLPSNGDGPDNYNQDKLIEEIAAVNPNTVVILNVSQPIAMPWLSKVKGVIQMWWTGDEGGWATAGILTGKTSPAGRLPFTWAKKLTDYAANDPAHPERSAKGVNGKTTFSEGVNVGYRWFDKQKIEPLFPFGFGLTYTTFAYSDLKATPAGNGDLQVAFTLKNTGTMPSDEVPQVYLGEPQHKQAGDFPVHELVAFDRIHLAPGDSKQVVILVPKHRLEFWNTKADKWTVATGPRPVLVGSSSRDLPLTATVNIP